MQTITVAMDIYNHVHHVLGHSNKKTHQKPQTVKTFIKGIKTKEKNNPLKVKQNQDFLPVHETLTLDP